MTDTRWLEYFEDVKGISKFIGVRLGLEIQSMVRQGIQMKLQFGGFVILIWFEVFIDLKDLIGNFSSLSFFICLFQLFNCQEIIIQFKYFYFF